MKKKILAIISLISVLFTNIASLNATQVGTVFATDNITNVMADTGVCYDDFQKYSNLATENVTSGNLADGIGWTSLTWLTEGSVSVQKGLIAEDTNVPYKKENYYSLKDDVSLKLGSKAKISRVMANQIDLSADGEYFIRIPFVVEVMGNSSYFYGHNLKVFLGNKNADGIVFGSKAVNSTPAGDTVPIGYNKSVAQLSHDAGNNFIVNNDISFDTRTYIEMVLHIVSARDSNDKIELYYTNYGDLLSAKPAITESINSNELFDRITLAGGNPDFVRISEVDIELYNNKIGNASTLSKYRDAISNENTYEAAKAVADKIVPQGITKEFLLKEFFDNSGETVVGNIEVVAGKDGLDEYADSDRISFGDSLFARTRVFSNNNNDKNAVTLFSVEYDGKLKHIGNAQSDISDDELAGNMSVRYDINEANGWNKSEFENNKLNLKLFVWNKDTLAQFMRINGASEKPTEHKEQQFIYVSAGAENGNGSKEKPYGTIIEARNKIRTIKKNGKYPKDGIIVYLRGGEYQVTETIAFTDSDSGTNDAPVVYRAYMNEKVSVVGGSEFDIDDFSAVTDRDSKNKLNASAKDKIRCINLKKLGITNYGNMNMIGYCKVYFTSPNSGLSNLPYYEQPPEVFFDDNVGVLARYPNNEYLKTGSIIQAGDEIQKWSHVFANTDTYIPPEDRTYPPNPSVYKVDESTKTRFANWVNESDPWVYGYFSENWADGSLPVRKFDSENGTITTELPSAKPIKPNMPYYVYNLLSELDSPGEYYLDRESGILYIYPTNNAKKVTFSDLNAQILSFRGAKNVKFKGIDFSGTRTTAIELKGCDNVDFELCSVSKAAERAIIATNSVNSDFISCHCYQTGTGGIYINTDKSSFGKEIGLDVDNNLTPQHNVIENCEIHDFSRISATYSPAVYLGGAGNTLRNSKIWSGSHYAIECKGNDCIIENCEFTDLLRTADDSGVIYANFNKERRGLVIRNNYFHDIYSTSAKGSDITCIYPDDTYSGVTAYQNLIVNVGGRFIQSNGGGEHEITNNIAINLGNKFMSIGNNEFGFDSGSEAGKYNWDRYTFQPYLNNPAYAKYKNFATLTQENYRQVRDIVTDNNVIWNVPIDIDSKAVPEWNQINPSLEIDSDPGFVDMKNGDYTLKADSEIYNTYDNFQAPNFKQMGLYSDMIKSTLGSGCAFLPYSQMIQKGEVRKKINSDRNIIAEDGFSSNDYNTVNLDTNINIVNAYNTENPGFGWDARWSMSADSYLAPLDEDNVKYYHLALKESEGSSVAYKKMLKLQQTPAGKMVYRKLDNPISFANANADYEISFDYLDGSSSAEYRVPLRFSIGDSIIIGHNRINSGEDIQPIISIDGKTFKADTGMRVGGDISDGEFVSYKVNIELDPNGEDTVTLTVQKRQSWQLNKAWEKGIDDDIITVVAKAEISDKLVDFISFGSTEDYKSSMHIQNVSIASNNSVPIIKNGVIYIPVNYVAEALDTTAEYDSTNNSFTVYYKNDIVITPDNYSVISGVPYLSAGIVKKFFGINVKKLGKDIIIMGNDIKIEAEDTRILNELYRRLSND